MTLLFVCQGLLFIVLGIPLYLKKIGPNGFYGFRTNKTLSDPEIWHAVNRIGGIDMCIAGSLIILGSLLFKIFLNSYDPSILAYANLALLIGAVTAVIVHFIIVLRRY